MGTDSTLNPTDCLDYFWAVSEILDSAKECIFILDWWLSPELYLRRPPADFPQFRLDRLLKRKAEQGVKVYICVYKEITQTMNMSSNHTKVSYPPVLSAAVVGSLIGWLGCFYIGSVASAASEY